MNPWLGVGTAALGCAALAYRLREPKSTWQKAGERADELLSQTAEHLHSWPAVIADAALGAVSAAFNAKSRQRATNAVADQAADAAERFADAGSRIWRRLQTISKEAGELYPQVRKVIA
jgi:ABC-type transporter Mla subunit MlaD